MDKNLASNKGYEPKLKWVAIYHNGTTLSSDDGTSEEIDRRNLKSMIIVDTDGNPVITQHFYPGQKLLYRCRTVMRTGVGVLDRVHILGWEESGIWHVAFISENDKSIEMGRFIDPHHPQAKEKPWYYPIEPTEIDLIQVEPQNQYALDILPQNQDTKPASEKTDELSPPVPGQIQSSSNSLIE